MINIVVCATTFYFFNYFCTMQLKIESIDYSNTLGPWIGKTYKIMDAFMDSYLLENNVPISKQQWLVLNLIKNNAGLSQNELANFIHRDKTSVTRFIKNLEKKELIERKSSKEDKRVKHLHLSQKGKDILTKTTPLIKKAILDLQNELSSEEVQLAINSLKKIQEKIKHLNNNK